MRFNPLHTLRFIGAVLLALCFSIAARAEEPVKIGFSMALSGGLAANGVAALKAMEIWRDDQNAAGGLLGRPVELVYYDDQSNPGLVPAIYTKLLDVDKVDFVVSSYGTNLAVPAMPLVISRKLVFVSLLSLGVNTQFHYDRYFSMIGFGPDPIANLSKGFFEIAAAQTPAPKTIAILAADAEFSKNAADGARAHAKAAGLDIVFDRSYPPSTVDFSSIVRAVQAASPDIVFVGSYPPDSAGIIRAANEIGLKPKLFGGGMVGLQFAALKTQLGPLLNGVVNYDFYVPEATMRTEARDAFLAKYQAAVAGQPVDQLGYYAPPFAYSQLQVLGKAITATGGLDQTKVADYLRTNEIDTVVGKIRFGSNGEWAESGVLTVQFKGIAGGDLAQFTKQGVQQIVAPAALSTGTVIYPYEDARK